MKKKNVLYIDTNIYLRFYDTKSTEFKKLLKALVEVRNNIFVTKQIEHEVDRNKLNISLSLLRNEQFELNPIALLPEHLETRTDREVKKWNDKARKLNKGIEEHKKLLKKITATLVDDISDNRDKVSEKMKSIFSSTKAATKDQIERARLRKELGNPPGKNTDPLGDQISWEQLLDEAGQIERLWIISDDRDYMTEFNKKFHLNVFLVGELQERNKNIEIFCFNKLSDGLNSFNSLATIKIKSLPNEKQLNLIREEEVQSPLNEFVWYGKTHDIQSHTVAASYVSPVITTWSQLNNNQFGGGALFMNTYQKRCPKCKSDNLLRIVGPIHNEWIGTLWSSIPYNYLCANCKEILSYDELADKD